ncbi:hypothetical protein P4T20_13785 [Aneurinibacillus thermoaerophilus]|uniref:hypothetical protein n=1 Tax=Aneurinibacillus thermoaerophilus TaxID=143495 RepID=UPI002E1B7098|nr:hypothetical protein [Aneurinibacillus thermoaerophilus]
MDELRLLAGKWFRYHDDGAQMNILGTFVDGEEKCRVNDGRKRKLHIWNKNGVFTVQKQLQKDSEGLHALLETRHGKGDYHVHHSLMTVLHFIS